VSTLPDFGARLLRSRRLVRAPIWLYRIRAGGLLGTRMMMLEHIGRTSGERRYVVLEETLGRPITETETPLPMVEIRLGPNR
jgi:hypothetical protein